MKKTILFSLLITSTSTYASDLYSDAYLIQERESLKDQTAHTFSIGQSLNNDIYNLTSFTYSYDTYLNDFLSLSPEVSITRRELKDSHKTLIGMIQDKPAIISPQPDASAGARLNFLPVTGVGNLLNRTELDFSVGTSIGFSADKYEDFISPGGYIGLNLNFKSLSRQYGIEIKQNFRQNTEYFDHFTSLSFSVSLF
ncbi:MAG: hypothetical protein EP319_02795 [Deltaproteobacteria bacterium]|nr:MAG: hypothetical protein EP319_02795 [Deltaproteobacteria bacterium]